MVVPLEEVGRVAEAQKRLKKRPRQLADKCLDTYRLQMFLALARAALCAARLTTLVTVGSGSGA